MNSPENAIMPCTNAFECFLIMSAIEGGTGFTNMEANKLVYITHGYTLASMDKPLIDNSSDIRAWKHGPVIVSLYHKLKIFDGNKINIDKYINENLNTKEAIFEEIYRMYQDESYEKALFLLDWVKQNYGSWSGTALRGITHKKGTPWRFCWDNIGPDAHISDEFIKPHYSKYVKRLES